MKRGVVPITVELDRDVNAEIEKWAEREERSKRRHITVLATRLVRLSKTHADDLRRLGLMTVGEG